ncbi:glutathione-disulfide reductase [Jiella mangrovi]|uniref:Glutathione reductase n=1 Tax=Jiella mangrovi TaxID=2821407 RepID=A0ABS4BGS2_9HYPH|nr:glutathione-disulfide reductase [Jiella mangrovi]MBP0615901.1 glutathione-disulfide reductase [Jiella mangrovi]
MPAYDYDLFVIGGGSGGVRAARVAASLGKRVAIAEEYRFGGTCVIRGCVPKKLFVYASQFPEHFEDAKGFGWSVGESRFDWSKLMAAKDKEIERLEGLYQTNAGKAGAETITDRAVLEGPHEIRLVGSGRTVTADKILIATGGRPNRFPAMPGAEHCITSEEAFHLPELPKRIAVLGGGYIAVEFANIFHGLGVETVLVYRGKEILQGFDDDLRHELHEAMERKGLRVHCCDTFEKVEMRGDGTLAATCKSGEVMIVDQVMLAIGRTANTENLGCEKAGVELDERGAVIVDEHSRTSAENIYAIGDVTHRVQLTPVAIHEAMCLIDTLYRDKPTSPDYGAIATAVFSQPELGVVGLSEQEAAKRFADVEIYRASFRPMKATLSGRSERMLMKLVVDGESRRVLGAHVLGADAGELAQVLAIAVKAELTKDQFDATMAVHPTAAEELVTMYQPSYRLKDGNRV